MSRKEIPRHFFSGAAPIALVAGGAGFIGSHFCERLLGKNVRVICIDDWLTGVRENISHLKEDENFLFIEDDITKKLPKNIERLDYVIHLAAVEAYLNGEDISKETLEANSIGTRNLLELAKRKSARFLLVSTIGVFAANISPDDIKEYFGKERIQEGEFSHHEAKRFAEALVSEYGSKEGVDARIVRLADVYGPRMMLSNARLLSQLIKQAVYGGPLKVPGGEEVNLYPTYITDVIDGMSKALFSSGTKNKILSLTGPKTSAFSIAEAIKFVINNNPKLSELKKESLETGFYEENYPSKDYSPEVLEAGRSLLSWEPETVLEQGLVETLSWFNVHKSRIPPQKKELKERSFWSEVRADPKSWKNLAALLLGILLFWFLLLPPLQLTVSSAQLVLVKNRALAGDFTQTVFWAKGAVSWTRGAEEGFARWQQIPGLNLAANPFLDKSRLFTRLSQVALSGAEAGKGAQVLFTGVFGEEPFDPQIPADKLALELGTLDRELAFLETELSPNGEVLSREFDLVDIRNSINGVLPFLRQANELLGSRGKKVYLVLLQNNMELRPTGGFIGSFALLTFENGRFINLEVQDVYTADGQLKGHIEPPGPIKEHLGEASWYLRDSNWSPDFPTTAQRAVWFIEKELGQKVDGVIGVDLEIAQKLLAAIGPITLSDFNEQVTSDNLYEKTQYAVEGDFFPGSRAKKDFLTALSRELLFELFDSNEKENRSFNMTVLARSALSVLKSRHMAVWIDNSEVMAGLRRAGWDGGLRSISCRSEENCLADYLMLVEANLGVNKANYFLDRSFSLELLPGSEAVEHKITITYQNRSQQEVWPGGDYKNYIRFLVPQKAGNSTARIINSSTGEETNPEIDNQIEKVGKRSFGMLVNVPAGEARQLIFSWDVSLEKTGIEEIALLWQKQLGMSDDPVWLNAKLPKGSQVSSVFPEPSLTTSSSVGYNTSLSKDLLFNIKWQMQR